MNSLLKKKADLRKKIEDKGAEVQKDAQNLALKAKDLRGCEENLLYSTNGVVYEDFHITKKLEIPSKIKNF